MSEHKNGTATPTPATDPLWEAFTRFRLARGEVEAYGPGAWEWECFKAGAKAQKEIVGRIINRRLNQREAK